MKTLFWLLRPSIWGSGSHCYSKKLIAYYRYPFNFYFHIKIFVPSLHFNTSHTVHSLLYALFMVHSFTVSFTLLSLTQYLISLLVIHCSCLGVITFSLVAFLADSPAEGNRAADQKRTQRSGSVLSVYCLRYSAPMSQWNFFLSWTQNDESHIGESSGNPWFS